MSMTKIALSLPTGLVETARQAVRDGQASSVSAYVAQALEVRSKAVQVERYVDSLIKEFGSPSADDYRWADHQLDRAGVPRGA